MVHVRRLDALWLGLQNATQIVWFWNPLVWWTAGRLNDARERIADDAVLASRRIAPRDYAASLLAVLRLDLTAPGGLAAAPALGNPKRRIVMRLHDILHHRPAPRSRVRKVAPALVSALCALVLLPMASVSTAAAPATGSRSRCARPRPRRPRLPSRPPPRRPWPPPELQSPCRPGRRWPRPRCPHRPLPRSLCRPRRRRWRSRLSLRPRCRGRPSLRPHSRRQRWPRLLCRLSQPRCPHRLLPRLLCRPPRLRSPRRLWLRSPGRPPRLRRRRRSPPRNPRRCPARSPTAS